MAGNCDFRDMERLLSGLEQTEKYLDKFMENCAKELAARLLAKVIKRTPVGQYENSTGKVGGTLRRGWTTGSEKQAMYTALFGGGKDGIGGTGNMKAVYGTGAVAEGAAGYANSLTVTREGNDYVVEIINPVEYASYVEYGHRTRGGKGWVPGRFMMTISEQEIEKSAPAILERKIKKAMEEAIK